jgi:hypothetical protein
MIKPSSVTVMVPAAVPNNKTDVNTNVSETEIVAGIDGSFIVIDPLSNVRAARRNHCDGTGTEYNAWAECTITSSPKRTTAEMKA